MARGFTETLTTSVVFVASDTQLFAGTLHIPATSYKLLSNVHVHKFKGHHHKVTELIISSKSISGQ